MKKILFFSMFVGFGIAAFAQNIHFADANLKSYLISENCVDSNNDGIADNDVDTNDDNEIQLSEALAVTSLMLGSFPDTYHITSVDDLHHFENIEKLRILWLASLEQVELLGLTNITDLQIGSCASLKRIDISDLPNIVNQRIEDLSLDYLNMQNNSFPSGFFSLFYTENISYACIDDLPQEHAAMQDHMEAGITPAINCELSTPSFDLQNDVQLLPNPVTDVLLLSSKNKVPNKLSIIDVSGRIVKVYQNDLMKTNVSFLSKGVYFVKVYFENNQYIMKKLIKN
ncbi:T9SS type A sorting domain-containing protein [uncultured Kordia sp.]|uniref:T9SS type A sorting domain-containing protein n=1 Tax=uncultured Kordia sp. TaxID=507699 RepID=UPI00260EB2F5|nr:T9SS type A sorting domain-containing protein [uncultured Kordia sp.]